MGLFSNKEIKNSKNERIKLQNIIFNTDEKELLSSADFLEEMTTKYISKRMKAINEFVEAFHSTKAASKFFTYYDSALVLLDELIKIEPYHKFKDPVPSVFKAALMDNIGCSTNVMVTRVCKYTLNRLPIEEGVTESKRREYDMVINDLLKYKDRFSQKELDLIEDMRKKAYGIEDDAPSENTDEEAVGEQNEQLVEEPTQQ